MILMHIFLIWRIGFWQEINYPQKVVEEQIDDKVGFGKQPTRKDNSEQVVPFAAPYRPKLKDLG